MPIPRRSFVLGSTALGAGASLGLVASPAHAAVRGPVVVASAPAGRRAYFADMIRLQDGRLLVAYREGSGHISQDGRLMTVVSADEGRTWSAPRVALDAAVDDRDPKLVQLRDGTVLMNFFRTDWTGYPKGKATLIGTFVSRSTDGGTTWSSPVQVGSAMNERRGIAWKIYNAGLAASHGPIVELPDGDLLVPLYGVMPDGVDCPASVVRSTDGGLTWPASGESFIGRHMGLELQEPNLTVLRHGLVVAIIRTSTVSAHISWSRDGGRTWSLPRDTGLKASSHHQLLTRSGDILLTYGDKSGQFGPGRPTVGRLLQHPESGVDAKRDVLLYDAARNGPATDDQANPSSVELSPNRFFTVTSDPHLASVVGVWSDRVDYVRMS